MNKILAWENEGQICNLWVNWRSTEAGIYRQRKIQSTKRVYGWSRELDGHGLTVTCESFEGFYPNIPIVHPEVVLNNLTWDIYSKKIFCLMILSDNQNVIVSSKFVNPFRSSLSCQSDNTYFLTTHPILNYTPNW